MKKKGRRGNGNPGVTGGRKKVVGNWWGGKLSRSDI